jgi:antitoxin component of MazEF toxin-antitoxin module
MQYSYNDIFTKKENGEFDMKLPDEVIEKLGLEPGDTVKVEVGDKGSLIISKVPVDAS